jgi:hypothetical protein
LVLVESEELNILEPALDGARDDSDNINCIWEAGGFWHGVAVDAVLAGKAGTAAGLIVVVDVELASVRVVARSGGRSVELHAEQWAKIVTFFWHRLRPPVLELQVRQLEGAANVELTK